MFRTQNAGQNHNKEIIHEVHVVVKKFKYLWTTEEINLTFAKKINRRLNSGSACYHSVQDLLFYYILSKNVILPVVLYGCEIWSLAMRTYS